MIKFFKRLPFWLKFLLCFILAIVMIRLSIKIHELYRVNTKYSAIIRVLGLGERMISYGYVNSGSCTYVEFAHFPELKDRPIINFAKPSDWDKKSKYLSNDIDTECLKDAELIAIGYQYGHATATYSCEKNDVITEVTLTDFQDSCVYMQYLKSWNLPVGKYSLLSINRP